MPIVDAHAHIYPEAIAAKAMESVLNFYQIPKSYETEGTAKAAIDDCKECGITHFVSYSVALKPKNVESINTFIAQEAAEHPEIIGFATLHQDYENPEAEIDRALSLGLRGIKLHPDTQGVNADDPRLMDIYEIAQAKDVPLVIHTGDYRFDYSHPHRIKNILRSFPNLRVNAAHFGGWSVFDMGADLLVHENCYVDSSSSFQFIGMRHGHELINLYGDERVLFGSDFPMWDPTKELAILKEMGLSQKAFENITWHNAERFIGIEIK